MSDFESFFENFTKKKISFLLSILLAIFFFFRFLPSMSIRDFDSLDSLDSLPLVDATAISAATEGTAIIDKGNTRLLLLDRDEKVVAAVDMTDIGSPFDKIYDVAVSPLGIYVTGARFHSGGTNVLSEGLALYSYDGVFQQMITGDDYTNLPLSDMVPFPRYKRIAWRNNMIFLYELGSSEVKMQKISPEENYGRVTVSLSGAFSKIFPLDGKGNLLLVSDTGLCYLYDYTAAALNNIDYKSAQHYMRRSLDIPPSADNITFSDGLFPYNQRFSPVSYGRSSFYHIDWEGQLTLYSLLDNTERKITAFSLSTPLLIKKLIFCISAIYLILLSLLFLRLAIRYIAYFPALKRNILRFLLLLLLTGCISFYYTDSAFKVINDQHLSVIKTELRQLHLSLERDCRPTFQHIIEQAPLAYITNPANQDELTKLKHYIYDFTDLIEQHDGLYIELSLLDDKEHLYSLVDSSYLNNLGDLIDTLNGLQKDGGEDEIYLQDLPTGDFCGNYRFVRYSNEHNLKESRIVGMLDVGFLESALTYRQYKFALESFAGLLSVFIVIYVVFQIARLIATNILSYSEKKQQKKPLAYAELFPTLSFLFSQALHVDLLVNVFIVKSLLDTPDLASVAFWVALSASACFTGTFAGSLLLSWLQKRLPARQLGMVLGLGSMLSLALPIIALYLGDVRLYIAARLCVGLVLNGCFFNWFSLLPTAFEKSLFSSIMYANRRAYDMSTIVSCMLTVYIYQYFGGAVLYGLAIVICAVILLIMLRFRWQTQDTPAKTAEKEAARPAWHFFLLPPIAIGIIFVLLPESLSYFYCPYLFPVLADNNGISPTMISSVTVFARVLSIAVRNNVSAIKLKLGSDKAVIIGLSLFGWTYGMFFANSGLLWSTIALFAIISLHDCTDSTYYVLDKANRYGFDPSAVGPAFMSINAAVMSLSPIIMSKGIKYLDLRHACMAIGIFCLLSALVVWRLNRKEKTVETENV